MMAPETQNYRDILLSDIAFKVRRKTEMPPIASQALVSLLYIAV
jgi:hypothetical protein